MGTPIGAGMPVQLTLHNVNGTSVFGIDGSSLNLVKRDGQDAWKPVDKFDGPVSSADLDANYGVWMDSKRVKDGWLGEKVLRPYDGQPQNDEVLPFDSFRGFQHGYITHFKQDQDDDFWCDSAQLTPAADGTHASLTSTWSQDESYNGMNGLFGAHASPMAPASVQQNVAAQDGADQSWNVPLYSCLKERDGQWYPCDDSR